MPGKTGFWDQTEADTQHDFSIQLAEFIAGYFPKDELLIDMGCGKGKYLRYLADRGFEYLLGIEGYPLQDFEYTSVTVLDLAYNITLSSKGNILCLEVGEHIPEEFSDTFLNNITNNVKEKHKLFLSWAIPDQEGYYHVSCRSNLWVINELEKRNFKLLAENSMKARAAVEERFQYFKNTILIFQNNN